MPASQSQRAATTPTSCDWTAASTPRFADLTLPVADPRVGAGFCLSLLGCGQPLAAWRGGNIDLYVCAAWVHAAWSDTPTGRWPGAQGARGPGRALPRNARRRDASARA